MTTPSTTLRSANDIYDNLIYRPAKIEGQPSYADLTLMRSKLYKDAAIIDSTRGGGRHGHLGFLMHPDMYANISNVPWETPVEPVLADLTNLTQAQIAAAKETYYKALREYNECYNLDKALKRAICNAIDPIYIGPLEEDHVGLINKSTRNVLEWLISYYGRILPHQAVANRKRLHDPWTITEPFQTLNARFKQVKEYASDHGVPVTDLELITNGLNHLVQTNVLQLPLQQWHAKPIANKDTWKKFVEHFGPLIHEYQIQSNNSPYFAGNTQQITDQLVQPIIQCLEIQQNDNQALFANMSTNTLSTNQRMTKIEDMMAKLVQLQLQSGLSQAPSTLTHNTSIPNATSKPALTDLTNTMAATGDINHRYCWSHGYGVSKNHSSWNCKQPKPNHQKTATRHNTMNGSTRGKPET